MLLAIALLLVAGQAIAQQYSILTSPADPNITISYRRPTAGTCTTVFDSQEQFSGYVNLPPFTLTPFQQNYSSTFAIQGAPEVVRISFGLLRRPERSTLPQAQLTRCCSQHILLVLRGSIEPRHSTTHNLAQWRTRLIQHDWTLPRARSLRDCSPPKRQLRNPTAPLGLGSEHELVVYRPAHANRLFIRRARQRFRRLHVWRYTTTSATPRRRTSMAFPQRDICLRTRVKHSTLNRHRRQSLLALSPKLPVGIPSVQPGDPGE